MTRTALVLIAAVTISSTAVGVGQALAKPARTSTPTLRVVMHDPGCHWFFVGGKFLKTESLAGPVRILNLDEATLKATSRAGVQRIPVGKSIVLTGGAYTITMVGQAPDDNHLKLTVRS